MQNNLEVLPRKNLIRFVDWVLILPGRCGSNLFEIRDLASFSNEIDLFYQIKFSMLIDHGQISKFRSIAPANRTKKSEKTSKISKL